MRVFLPLEAFGASFNGQNSVNPLVEPCFLRCCVFQTAINICAKISPKCFTKASQKRPKSEQKLLGQASKKQSVLLSKCARKGPPTRTHYLLILHSLLNIFSEPVPRLPKTSFAMTFAPKNHENHCSVYSLIRLFLHHFCLQKCACTCIPVQLFTPFVCYGFPSS